MPRHSGADSGPCLAGNAQELTCVALFAQETSVHWFAICSQLSGWRRIRGRADGTATGFVGHLPPRRRAATGSFASALLLDEIGIEADKEGYA